MIKLSEERSRVKEDKLKDPSLKPRYNYLTREIKRKTKGCKDQWIQNLCRDVENTHQATKSKEVYATMKTITKTPTIRRETIKSKDGRVLTDQNEVKGRWKENCEELYNEGSPFNLQETSLLPQMPMTEKEPEITRDEVVSAIKKLKHGKAPGYDNITGNELQAAGEQGVDIIHKLCKKYGQQKLSPKTGAKLSLHQSSKRKIN